MAADGKLRRQDALSQGNMRSPYTAIVAAAETLFPPRGCRITPIPVDTPFPRPPAGSVMATSPSHRRASRSPCSIDDAEGKAGALAGEQSFDAMVTGRRMFIASGIDRRRDLLRQRRACADACVRARAKAWLQPAGQLQDGPADWRMEEAQRLLV